VPSVQTDTNHGTLTARRRLTYVFTPKHHGGDGIASCWQTELPLADEFAIFDRADGVVVQPPADDQQVADCDGNVYGYEVMATGLQRLREIGTWHQQLAEFPIQKPGAAWHGYPIWPIDQEVAPKKHWGMKHRPEPEVFDRMVALGDIDEGQRKRLKKGDWI
jgi:hypothetical protein